LSAYAIRSGFCRPAPRRVVMAPLGTGAGLRYGGPPTGLWTTGRLDESDDSGPGPSTQIVDPQHRTLWRTSEDTYVRSPSERAIRSFTARRDPEAYGRSCAAESHNTECPKRSVTRLTGDFRALAARLARRVRQVTPDEMHNRLDAMARAVTPTKDEKGEQL
jgi:hypothetical protein